MNRQDKQILIESLRNSFSTSQASFLVKYKGLTVSQMQALRKGLRSNDASMKVAKARLMKRAVEGMEGADQLSPHFHDQIGAVFVKQSAPDAAKFLSEYAKQHAVFQLVVGVIDSQLYDATSINRIANLPSREVLLAQLCGTLQAPMTQTVTVMHLMIARLLFVLKQVEEQKQAGSAPEVAAPEVEAVSSASEDTGAE